MLYEQINSTQLTSHQLNPSFNLLAYVAVSNWRVRITQTLWVMACCVSGASGYCIVEVLSCYRLNLGSA